MKHSTSVLLKTGLKELDSKIEKYGVLEADKPQFVIVGVIKVPKKGWNGGVLAFSDNEFHAHLLKNELARFGEVSIERTQWHPEGETYSIKASKAINGLLSG